MFCNYCGASNPNDASFCSACGKAVASRANPPEDSRPAGDPIPVDASPQGRELSEADRQKIWSQIYLKPEIKESILSQIRMFNRSDKAAPRGLLLYGPPGTGKAQIARALANESGLPFIGASLLDMKAGFIGQSGQKVHEVFERARSKAPCILFIDEIDSVAAKRGSAQADSFTGEIVIQMLVEWDSAKRNDRPVFLLAATNRPELVDEAIRSRFGAAVEIGLPEAPQRLEILRMEMQKLERQVEIPDSVAGATTGFSGRDLSNLARQVCTLAAQRNTAITPEMWSQTLAPRQGQAVSDADLHARKGSSEAYDAQKAATTAQIVMAIGRWNENDATRALGTPTKQQPFNEGGISRQTNSYRYQDHANRMNEIDLTFKGQNGLLEMVSLNPADMPLAEMKKALGDRCVCTEITGTPWRTFDYAELHVGLIVDGAGIVRKIVLGSGADATALFSPSASWPAGMPWVCAQLAPPEDLFDLSRFQRL